MAMTRRGIEVIGQLSRNVARAAEDRGDIPITIRAEVSGDRMREESGRVLETIGSALSPSEGVLALPRCCGAGCRRRGPARGRGM